MLGAYVEYLMSEEGKHTLIMRIAGCYSIHLYGVTKYFFVMGNLFDPAVSKKPHEVYDLKGSWVDRHVGPPRTAKEKRKV